MPSPHSLLSVGGTQQSTNVRSKHENFYLVFNLERQYFANVTNLETALHVLGRKLRHFYERGA